MRSVLVLTGIAVLAGIAVACGGCGGAHASKAGFAEYRNDSDRDRVNDEDADDRRANKADDDNDYKEDHFDAGNDRYHDSDDSQLLSFGRPAGVADFNAVSSLLVRYYIAAQAENGAAACSMLLANLERAVPVDYGKSPGPRFLRGTSCQMVMGRLFAHQHSQLVGLRPHVTDVHVNGNDGIAFVGSPTMSASYIGVTREHGVWRIGGLLPGQLP